MERESIVRLSVPSSQRSIEACSCQCPISGTIPIVYNNRQQSCTIGTVRKRRSRYFNNDDGYFNPID